GGDVDGTAGAAGGAAAHVDAGTAQRHVTRRTDVHLAAATAAARVERAVAREGHVRFRTDQSTAAGWAVAACRNHHAALNGCSPLRVEIDLAAGAVRIGAFRQDARRDGERTEVRADAHTSAAAATGEGR